MEIFVLRTNVPSKPETPVGTSTDTILNYIVAVILLLKFYIIHLYIYTFYYFFFTTSSLIHLI